ncbi:hypothetical protein ACH47B_13050 [Rhodococcus sp. NPDC019627]|uniref:hypothetical protein n=1 Tax=unclassified Rhodococcus (in: high G+C Gram-positive bacteria) TaxID=192944 RepID=UPI0033DD60AD
MSLDDRSLVAAVRELAAENPDYVYKNQGGQQAGGGTSCFYVHDVGGKLCGGCLIGQGAIRAGEPIADVAAWDNADVADAQSVLPDSLSDRVRAWAFQVQVKQDIGWAWGAAVKYADEIEGDPLD